jgi:hypothetical protein
MEIGIVTETKHKKTITANMKTWIFATSNNTQKIMVSLQSRFFVVKLEPFTYEQFYQIHYSCLLTQQHKIKEDFYHLDSCAFIIDSSALNFALHFRFLGFILSLCPQQGHHIPSQFINISHS